MQHAVKAVQAPTAVLVGTLAEKRQKTKKQRTPPRSRDFPIPRLVPLLELSYHSAYLSAHQVCD